MNQMIKRLIFLLFLIFNLILVGCGKSIEQEVGYGRVSDNTYINEYFDLSIELPENWVIADMVKRKQILEEGDEVIGDNGVFDKLAEKVSLLRTINLFSSSKDELLEDEFSFTPSMIGLSEKSSGMFGVGKASAYLDILKDKLLETDFPYHFSNINPQAHYAGMTFDTLSGNLQGDKYLNVHQDYYVTRIKGYMFVLIMSYVDEEDKETMLNSLKSLKRLNEETK